MPTDLPNPLPSPPEMAQQWLGAAEAALARGEQMPPAPAGLPVWVAADADHPWAAVGELLAIGAMLGTNDPPEFPGGTGADEVYPIGNTTLVGTNALGHCSALGLVDAWAAQAESGPERAKRWLESPARRLMNDLRTLVALRGDAPADWPMGAMIAGGSRVEACFAGQALQAPPTGKALEKWLPQGENPTAVALFHLDWPDPPSLRGAAIAYLLDRAATRPIWQTPGPTPVGRDLRDDLAPALAMAWAPERTDRGRQSALIQVESALFLHADLIADQIGVPADGVIKRWELARWLQRTVDASPFWRIDPAVLAIRLHELLPSAVRLVHPQSPSGVARAGIEETFMVMGAAAGTRSNRPIAPVPLLDRLRELARRTAQAEPPATMFSAHNQHSGEAGPNNPSDPLGWNELTSLLSPPWIARFLLTMRLSASWLKEAPPEVQQKSLELLAHSPDRWSFVARAWHDEGPHLSPETVGVGRKGLPALQGTPWAFGLVAAGVASSLSAEELATTFALIERDPNWAPVVLAGLARADTSRIPALQALLCLAEDPKITEGARLNALMRSLTVLDKTSPSERSSQEYRTFLDRVRRLGTTRPFQANLQVQQVLQRVAR
jgi:hypothetical protein